MSNARRFSLDLVPASLDAEIVTPAIATAPAAVPAGFVVIAFFNPWALAGAVLAHARRVAALAAAAERPVVVSPRGSLPALYGLN